MILLNLEQGSQEWLDARLGIPTASRFKDIITPAKGEKSTSSGKYMNELLAERLIKESEGFSGNQWTERGNELEPLARMTYEFIHDVEVSQVGIILNDEKTIGASPDGLINNIGGLEIKCLKASTVVEHFLKGGVPLDYKTQIQGNLWLSEREWWDFMIYHPKIKPQITRVYRDEEYIAKMQSIIFDFVGELETKWNKVKELAGENPSN